MAMILALIGVVAGVGGSAMQSSAAIKQGKQAQAFKEKQAQAAMAEAGYKAWNEKETKDRIVSRATALAAAGGGGVHDTTVQNIIADLEGEGTYRQSLQIYQGEAQARLLREQGDAAKEEGRDRADYYGMQGAATALQGASSLYSKYKTGGYG